jgi:uncharacterized lipoprotein
MNRTLAVLTPAALTLALLAGCGKKEADSSMMRDGAPSAGQTSTAPPMTSASGVAPVPNAMPSGAGSASAP